MDTGDEILLGTRRWLLKQRRERLCQRLHAICSKFGPINPESQLVALSDEDVAFFDRMDTETLEDAVIESLWGGKSDAELKNAFGR